jgi:hypothetical protein
MATMTKAADKLFIDIRLIDKWNNCVLKKQVVK